MGPCRSWNLTPGLFTPEVLNLCELRRRCMEWAKTCVDKRKRVLLFFLLLFLLASVRAPFLTLNHILGRSVAFWSLSALKHSVQLKTLFSLPFQSCTFPQLRSDPNRSKVLSLFCSSFTSFLSCLWLLGSLGREEGN